MHKDKPLPTEFWEWCGAFRTRSLFDLKAKPKLQIIPIKGATHCLAGEYQHTEASPHTIMLDSCKTAVFTREQHARFNGSPTITMFEFDNTVCGNLFRGQYSETDEMKKPVMKNAIGKIDDTARSQSSASHRPRRPLKAHLPLSK